MKNAAEEQKAEHEEQDVTGYKVGMLALAASLQTA
jgi:hypothetical protein